MICLNRFVYRVWLYNIIVYNRWIDTEKYSYRKIPYANEFYPMRGRERRFSRVKKKVVRPRTTFHYSEPEWMIWLSMLYDNRKTMESVLYSFRHSLFRIIKLTRSQKPRSFVLWHFTSREHAHFPWSNPLYTTQKTNIILLVGSYLKTYSLQ